MSTMKTVFHVHTNHSHDCDKSCDDLIALARRRNIGCLAITDHDTITGAREIAAKAPADLQIIIGQEVTTTAGHVIGLFLREVIEPGMSPRETALAIKEQGGLVVIPHPFNLLFGCGLRRHVYDLIDLIDIVEVSNAQNLWSYPNRRAQRFAEKHDFPQIVGVDMHFGDELDACYQELEPFHTSSEFINSLRQAALCRGRHTLAYFAWTAWYVFLQSIGAGLPASFGLNSPGKDTSRKPELSTPLVSGQ